MRGGPDLVIHVLDNISLFQTDLFFVLKKRKFANSEKLKLICFFKPNEPCHEIMILFVLSKLILQMHMRSRPVRLDV